MYKIVFLLACIFIPFANFASMCPELENFDWYNAEERIYYKAGVLYMKKALTLTNDIQDHDSLKYDMIYVIEAYIRHISYDKKNNAELAHHCWWDCIRVINKHDFIPDKWKEIDPCLKKAIENFKLDDKRT